MLKKMMFITVTAVLIVIFWIIAFAKSAEKINAVVSYNENYEDIAVYSVDNKKCVSLDDMAVILKDTNIRFDFKKDEKSGGVIIEKGKEFKGKGFSYDGKESVGYSSVHIPFDVSGETFESDAYEIENSYFISFEDAAKLLGFVLYDRDGSEHCFRKNIKTLSDIMEDEEKPEYINTIFDKDRIEGLKDIIRKKLEEKYGEDAITDAVYKVIDSEKPYHDCEFENEEIKIKIYTKEISVPYSEASEFLKDEYSCYAVISEFSANEGEKSFMASAVKVKKAAKSSSELIINEIEEESSSYEESSAYEETSSYEETATWRQTSENTLNEQNKDELVIALTFDDGPKRKTTEKILSILKKYNAKATFFVVGSMLEGNEDVVKKAYDQGCQIGNHTYSHSMLTKVPINKAKEEIAKTSNIVYKITGDYTRVGRPPYGSLNRQVKEISGIEWFNWSIDTYDWKTRNADSVYKEIMSNVGNHDVILMHDLYDSTVEAVERAVPELAEKGYRFVTISELAEIRGGAVNVSGHIKANK